MNPSSMAVVKISAIITTYNSAASIQRVIDSINNQQGNNSQFVMEIIVVDDCSTDQTPEIIRATGLEYISTGKNSGGPNKGRNIGLQKATGAFICIVDHDDEWHPDKILTCLPSFDKGMIITSGFTIFDTRTGKKTEIMGHCAEDQQILFFDENVTFLNKLARNKKGQNTYLGSILYPWALKHIHFEETYGMVDYDWLLQLFYGQCSLEICSSLYTRYVQGINLSLNETYRLNDYNHSLQFVQHYQKQYPSEVRQSISRINGSLARYYYLMDRMKEARRYFLRSELTLKTVMYYLTTFAGAGFVRRKFNIFG